MRFTWEQRSIRFRLLSFYFNKLSPNHGRNFGLERGIPAQLGLQKELAAVHNCRGIGKSDMVHNSLTPQVDVDPETYVVKANGEVLTCEPAPRLSLAQRYFLF